MFLNLFIDEEIATFLVVVILCSFDFWTVKNVTGRLLVNLRWWSEIDELGEEKWIYESDDGKKPVGKTDSFIFWSALYLYPCVWFLFGLMDFFGFKFLWLILCVLCFTLSLTNAQGYYCCQQDQKTKLSAFVQEKTLSFLPKIIGSFGSAGGSVASTLFGAVKSRFTKS